jgi:hypothetical protein
MVRQHFLKFLNRPFKSYDFSINVKSVSLILANFAKHRWTVQRTATACKILYISCGTVSLTVNRKIIKQALRMCK